MVASVWRHTVLLALQHGNTHPAFPTVTVDIDVLDIWHYDDIKPETPFCSHLLVHYLSQQKGKLTSVIVCGTAQTSFFISELFLLYDIWPVLDRHLWNPCSWLLCSLYNMNSYFVCSYLMHIEWYIFSTSNWTLSWGSMRRNFNDSCRESGKQCC